METNTNFKNCYEDGIHSSDMAKLGNGAFQVMQKTIQYNGGVGTMSGYFDADLSILSVSDLLLHNLGYSYTSLMQQTNGSLKNLFYGENVSFLENERFRQIQGEGEGQILTADGSPVYVRLYKENAADTDGTPLWVMSVHMDWELENLALVSQSIGSALWYFDCDENGEIARVNWSHAFRLLLGYHDVLDFPNRLDSWVRLLHPEDQERVLALLHKALADRTNQTKYTVEYRLKMPNNQYRWFRTSAEIVRRLNGTAHRIAGIISNIDAEKRSLMQAQRAAAFHRAFTNANLCEYYVNLDKNTFDTFKVEPSLMTAFEQSETWDELVRFFVDNYVVEQDKKAVIEFYNRAYIAKKLKGLESELCQECRIVLNGEERWVRNVVMRGEMEDSEYAMIFLRDITEAKAETARRTQMASDNASLEQLIQSVVRLVDHFSVCDLKNDSYVLYNINERTAYKPSGAFHELCASVLEKYKTLAPLEAMGVLLTPENILKNLTLKDDIYKFEYCSLDENIYKIASFIPLEWDGAKPVKVLWTCMDITQEKKVEIESRRALKEAYRAAENANRAKTEFLSNMSHDIRTPMNAIIGLTAIAGANIENTEKLTECLGKITKSSRHLLGLINEVLDMARIESGKMALAEEDFSLPELVDNLLTLTKPAIDEHRHNLEVQIDHIEHEAVCGDSLRIQQLFVNLMGNAIKYTPDGGDITFSIKEKPNGFSELGCYEFSISDNGIGMTPEFQKIMFEPFSRADDHRTTKVQGTGLGMAITKNIVDMMNGSIAVKSAPNQGTTITVTIYLKLQESERVQEKELMDLPVLVVDDDKICCESTVATLKDIGIAGEWVLTGKEAVARCSARHKANRDYFAVILDWKMPGMDGIETARRIRAQVGDEVPIIILTSFEFSEIEEEARKAGVNAFIAKPLFRSRLTATLRKFTSGKKEDNAETYLEAFAKADYTGKRILLVEDNELNREIASEILGMTGVTVEMAENGKLAVDKVSEAPENWYNLIFMDIQMPIMNGYEATAAIRALPGSRGKVPIIAMTANAFAEDVQLAKNTGMNEHIAKPLELAKLFDVLKQWL